MLTYEKYDMKGIQISTKISNFGVIGSHSNWENNWSMKRNTSVMRVTKPLKLSWRMLMEGNSTLGGLMKLIKGFNEEG